MNAPDPPKPAANEAQPFRVVDRRHSFNLSGDEAPGPVEERPRYPSYVEELRAQVAETERRFEEKKKQIDTEIRRTKERLEADLSRALQAEKQKLILPFLNILDDLERALGASATGESAVGLRAGVEMIADQFHKTLLALGVEPLSLLRRHYDPNLGQAIGVVPVSDPEMDGIVVDEVQRGYRMGDQLIRPAQVRVAQLVQKS